jgi:hypothetical protein
MTTYYRINTYINGTIQSFPGKYVRLYDQLIHKYHISARVRILNLKVFFSRFQSLKFIVGLSMAAIKAFNFTTSSFQ